MEPKLFLVCAVIGVYCFIRGSFGSQIILLGEDLKAPKSVKSFKFPSGDIVDCIDIFRQPAFDHPLLKNHTLQQELPVIPKDLGINTLNDKVQLTGSSSNEDLCPQLTVPIRRTERKYDDHNRYRFAILRLKREADDMFHGASAQIRADNPKCEKGQTSGSSIWIGSDLSDQKNFLKAGWIVNPKIYGDSLSRVSIYWTGDGFHKTGCYDLQCPGFIQVDNTAVVGLPLNHISGERIWETNFYIFQDKNSGNWWLLLTSQNENTFVGYWPSELFPRLRNGATIIHFGGSTSTRPGLQFPPMGNGKFPSRNYRASNYLRFLKYVDKSNNLIPPRVTETYSDKLKCYDLQYDDHDRKNMGHVLYVGGPGGDC